MAQPSSTRIRAWIEFGLRIVGWLHKAINLTKALTGSLKEGFKRDVEALAQAEEQGEDEEDDSTDQDGIMPRAPSDGHMAVWIMFKLLCPLFHKDGLRRGKPYVSRPQNGIALDVNVVVRACFSDSCLFVHVPLTINENSTSLSVIPDSTDGMTRWRQMGSTPRTGWPSQATESRHGCSLVGSFVGYSSIPTSVVHGAVCVALQGVTLPSAATTCP